MASEKQLQAKARAADDEAARDNGKAEAVGRAVRVLFQFSRSNSALSLDALSLRTNVPKPTLLGILQTLSHHDFLKFDAESDSYRLGYAWLRFAEIRRNQSHIRESALPIMREIRDSMDETVILSLRVGDQRIHLDYVESTQPIRRRSKPGREAPLHRGAVGVVLLAGMGDEDVRAYLSARSELNEITRKNIMEAAASARRTGYAVFAGEQVAAVAAPIKSYSGATVAALSISGPTDRFSKKLAREWAASVIEGARKLSGSLGYKIA